MKTRIRVQKAEIQDLNIPNWMGSQISPDNFDLLKKGKKTRPVELIDEKGKRHYGILQAFENDGVSKISIHKVNPKKEIDYPYEIDGELLDKSQFKLLKKGKFVALKNGNYLKVDKTLNKVLLYTGRELDAVTKVGNYTLSPVDKQRLLNEQSLTRVLNDKNGDYILTTIKFDNENKSFDIDLDQTKIISKHQAEKYLIDQKIENLNITNSDPKKTMVQFLEGNDRAMVELKEMQAAGYSPSMETLLEVTNNQESSRANQLINSFDIDSKQFEKLTTIYQENQARTLDSDQKLTISEIDIENQKIIGIDQDGEEKEVSFNEVRTEQEYQLYIQSQGKSKSQSKGISLNQ